MSILDANRLTDSSRDYLRALAVLRGELFGRPVRVPFVDEAQLLVVDGFFDILPVHAEILSLLVRRFPESIVNLNYDRRNPNAFIAFKDAVERFGDRAGFEEIAEVEGLPGGVSEKCIESGLCPCAGTPGNAQRREESSRD